MDKNYHVLVKIITNLLAKYLISVTHLLKIFNSVNFHNIKINLKFKFNLN